MIKKISSGFTTISLHNCGFTIVELVVAISIIAILSSVVFANFGTFEKDRTLISAASDLSTFLRVAQTNAKAGVICGSNKSAGWQVKIESAQNVNLYCSFISSNTPLELFQKSLKLDSKIRVNPIGDFSCQYPLKIDFSPLFGNITITDPTNCFNTSDTLTIELKNVDGEVKNVLVGKGGSIEID